MTADRYALAHAAYERRMELGMTQEQVAERGGLQTRRTVGMVEAAQPVKPLTLALLDKGLDWAPGTARAILTGEAAAQRKPLTEAQGQELTRLVDAVVDAARETRFHLHEGTDAIHARIEAESVATKAVWVWILQHAEGDDPLGTKLGKETEQ